MARKFSELVAQMSPESRARSDALYRQLLAEMPLQELRRALDLTQQQVAAALGINQVAVSKMEGQTDMYVSTLRRFVEAMGGELHIVARFPQGTVEISQFKREREPEPAEPTAAA
ncbi:MAG: XRE family transcriptional regulator [Candidatus Competibacteraceae bacterium]